MLLANAMMDEGGGGGGGGGGDSDFSTCTISVVDSNEYSYFTSMPVIFEENALGPGSPPMIYTDYSASWSESGNFNVALYKGNAYCTFRVDVDAPPHTVSVTGGITDMGDGVMLISGNGTITIS